MRRRPTATLLLLTLLALPALRLSAAQPLEIVVTNNWTTPSFGITNLAGGAGTNFSSTPWESAANAVELEIKFSNPPWTVSVRKVDTSWNAVLHLSVRRTGAGVGGGTLSGGTTYQEITATDTAFFSGTGGDKKNIPLQFQISGVTVTLGAATFSTTVYYTVTDT
jgi:hypothetical protein